MKQLMASLAVLVCATAATAAPITGVNLGTAAPPATLGGYTMTPFGADNRSIGASVTTVPSPLTGNVSFSSSTTHYRIGNGWASWSHGYTGDVYFSDFASSLKLTLPTGTGAFYLYVEPNNFAIFEFTATANDGTKLDAKINGQAGANGFGFYAPAGSSIVSIDVATTPEAGGFAVGEFGIANSVVQPTAVPEPTTMLLGLQAGLVAFGAYGWRRRGQKQTA